MGRESFLFTSFGIKNKNGSGQKGNVVVKVKEIKTATAQMRIAVAVLRRMKTKL
jgi:hypothetical protein